MTMLLKLLAFVPITAKMRGNLYRFLTWKKKNYKIGKNFRIGFASYIDSKEVAIDQNVTIGNAVRVKYLDKFLLDEGTSIGSSTIICGAYDTNSVSLKAFSCGAYTEILCSHYFDVVAPITIGQHVTIAGKWTQFYTHSFDLEHNRLDGAITLGNHIYVGAGCLINLGVTICDNVVVQSGTCVNKDINEEGVYASQTFKKRGSVRKYSELFSGVQAAILKDGTKVYLKE